MLILPLLVACDFADDTRSARNEYPPAPSRPAAEPTAAQEKANRMLTYTARLDPKSGSTMGGTVTFNQDIEYDTVDLRRDMPGVDLERVPVGVEEAIKVTVHLTGAVPGDHSVYITQKGDCSAADAASAGDWLPVATVGEKVRDGEDRPGNLGVVKVGADGMGHSELNVDGFRLAPGAGSVDGLAVVVYQSKVTDDREPTAGHRQACGLIRRDDTSSIASDAPP